MHHKCFLHVNHQPNRCRSTQPTYSVGWQRAAVVQPCTLRWGGVDSKEVHSKRLRIIRMMESNTHSMQESHTSEVSGLQPSKVDHRGILRVLYLKSDINLRKYTYILRLS